MLPDAPYFHQAPTVRGIMGRVLLALLPAIFVHIWAFGPIILFDLLLCSTVALLLECGVLHLRSKPKKMFLQDGSAVVTAWLFVLSAPTSLPWWALFVGIFMAIVVAKHLFGGLGQNPFNPAMVGVCVLMVAYPTGMAQWPVALHGLMSKPADSFARLVVILLNAAYFLGGVSLIWQRIIPIKLPLVFLLTLFVGATLIWRVSSDEQLSLWFYLFNGVTVLGAFFILTDPVSGPTTAKGQVLAAIMVALMTLVIHIFGNYPNGFAFAILLMNLSVPFLDMKTQPPSFGRKKS